jgi:hypothetical protein
MGEPANAIDAVRPVPSAGSIAVRRRVPWRGLLLVALAFVLGWAASTAWSATGRVRLVEEITGTVSVVNESGGSFCLERAGGGRQRCGETYQRRDEPPLAVGDVVSVAVGILRVDGDEREIFLIESVD